MDNRSIGGHFWKPPRFLWKLKNSAFDETDRDTFVPIGKITKGEKASGERL
jgi:hypothetical protein